MASEVGIILEVVLLTGAGDADIRIVSQREPGGDSILDLRECGS